MRFIHLLVFAFSSTGMFCSLYGQGATAVSSSITGVTVYADRARITRTGVANLPAGRSVLEFSGLPAAVEEDSVVFSAQSDVPVTIEGIDIRQEFLASSADPKTQELERQLLGLQDQKKSIRAEKAVLEEKRQFFRNLSAGLGKGEKEPVNVDDIRKLYSFYGEEVSNLSENILTLDRSEVKIEPEAQSVPSTDAQAEIQKNGLSVTYQVALPVTIPGDGQSHRTNVSLLNLWGNPEYVTTPKLDASVFFKLHLRNNSDAPMLPGLVSIFRDAEFAGTIPIGLVPASSDFDLHVGTDDSIKVERKELAKKRSETGMLNRREVEDRKFQISLQNFRSGPIKILIYDQFPVSRNADIVVSQGAFSDKPSAFDKDSGKLDWNIDLQPKAKKVIEYNYSIEWPKGKEITELF